jgi:hypothetical protein
MTVSPRSIEPHIAVDGRVENAVRPGKAMRPGNTLQENLKSANKKTGGGAFSPTLPKRYFIKPASL